MKEPRPRVKGNPLVVGERTARFDVSTPKHPDTWAIIDAADVELVLDGGYRWHVAACGGILYVRRDQRGHLEYLHRLVMDPPEGFVVDHLDGNPLDNRRANMRVVPQGVNAVNCAMQRNNTTGRTGLRQRPSGRWQALHKNRSLGTFDTFEEACSARAAMEKKVGYIDRPPRDCGRVSQA